MARFQDLANRKPEFEGWISKAAAKQMGSLLS
jgi:hypothetical protein